MWLLFIIGTINIIFQVEYAKNRKIIERESEREMKIVS